MIVCAGRQHAENRRAATPTPAPRRATQRSAAAGARVAAAGIMSEASGRSSQPPRKVRGASRRRLRRSRRSSSANRESAGAVSRWSYCRTHRAEFAPAQVRSKLQPRNAKLQVTASDRALRPCDCSIFLIHGPERSTRATSSSKPVNCSFAARGARLLRTPWMPSSSARTSKGFRPSAPPSHPNPVFCRRRATGEVTARRLL